MIPWALSVDLSYVFGRRNMLEWEEEVKLCEIWFQEGLTDNDREWLRYHLALCDIKPPCLDIRWMTFEKIR